ncbi:Hypothetical predicted protein [Cloeon dipterum]|nr:Hypothetical predicted protein [Cloeon dipterum]
MEKKRRERMNNALSQLKRILLDYSPQKDPRHAKLEKADVLELTVRHVKELHQKVRMAETLMENGVGDKFLAGYQHCIREVQRFLDSYEVVDPKMKNALLAAVKYESKMRVSRSTPPRPMKTPSPLAAATPLAAAALRGIPCYEHLLPPRPMVSQSPDTHIQAAPASLNGLRLTPTLLPNGDFALVIPASQARSINYTTAVPCSPSPTCTVSSPFSASSTPPPLYYNGLLQHAMTPPQHAMTPPQHAMTPPGLPLGLPPVNLNLSVQARPIFRFNSPLQEKPLPLVKRAWQPWF